MKEFENPVVVIWGVTVATVTLSKRAEYPPAYSPKPVPLAAGLELLNWPVTVGQGAEPSGCAHPQAWKPWTVMLKVYQTPIMGHEAAAEGWVEFVPSHSRDSSKSSR